MEKIFVDTSAWVALFLKRDNSHQKATTIYKRLKGLKALIYTSDYIIDETITAILVKGNYQQSLIAGNAFFDSKIIKIVYVAPEHLECSWKLYQKYKDKKFSFTDVTSFTLMDKLGIKKAFAFDDDFLKVGFDIIDTL